MPDPTVVQNVNGTSTLATTSPSFSGAGAGNLLLLMWAADDYRSGTPSGFTQVAAEQQTFHGLNMFYKIAAGGETSASYTIGSAVRSSWKLIEFNNVSSFGNGVGAFQQTSGNTYTTTTLTPSAGRRLIVVAVGWSTSSTASQLTDSTWATISLTGAGSSIGPLSNPQETVSCGWTVADYNGSGTVATTATNGQTAQAKSGILGSFVVATTTVTQPVVRNSQAVRRAGNW